MTADDHRQREDAVLAKWEATLPVGITLARWYTRVKDEFLVHIEARGLSIATADVISVRAFIDPMPFSYQTIAVSQLRKLFSIAIADGLRNDDPVRVKLKKKEVELPIELTVGQVSRWLMHLQQRARSDDSGAHVILVSARTSAAFELIYSAGLKVHELRKLKRSDLFVQPPSINYPGIEGGRRVPITKSALKAIRWMEFLAFGYGDVRGEWLFHSSQQPLAAINEQSFSAGIRTAISTAPLDLRHLVSPDAVRYSLACHLVAAGMNQSEVTYLFGYTQRYFLQRAFPTLFV